jgi:hypothetical protein
MRTCPCPSQSIRVSHLSQPSESAIRVSHPSQPSEAAIRGSHPRQPSEAAIRVTGSGGASSRPFRRPARVPPSAPPPRRRRPPQHRHPSHYPVATSRRAAAHPISCRGGSAVFGSCGGVAPGRMAPWGVPKRSCRLAVLWCFSVLFCVCVCVRAHGCMRVCASLPRVSPFCCTFEHRHAFVSAIMLLLGLVRAFLSGAYMQHAPAQTHPSFLPAFTDQPARRALPHARPVCHSCMHKAHGQD